MSDSVRGQEVLLLDADPGVQQGIYQLLSTAGLIVTALADPAAARKEAADRFFSVVLVDIDTPEAYARFAAHPPGRAVPGDGSLFD